MIKVKKRALYFIFTMLIAFCTLCGGLNISNQVFADEPLILVSGAEGVEYSQSVRSSTHTTGYKYVITNGLLLEGLTISDDGIVSGIPLESGKLKFDLNVLNSSNSVVEEKVCELEIKPITPYAMQKNERKNIEKRYYNGILDKTYDVVNEEIREFDSQLNQRRIISSGYQGTLNKKTIYTMIYNENGKVIKNIQSSYNENGYITNKGYVNTEYDENGKISLLNSINNIKNGDRVECGKMVWRYLYSENTVLQKQESYTKIDNQFVCNYYVENSQTKTGDNITNYIFRYKDLQKTELISKNVTESTPTVITNQSWNRMSSKFIYRKNIETTVGDVKTIIEYSYEPTTYTGMTDFERNNFVEISHEKMVLKEWADENEIDYYEENIYNSNNELIQKSKQTSQVIKDEKNNKILLQEVYRNDFLVNEIVLDIQMGDLIIYDSNVLLKALTDENSKFEYRIVADKGIDLIITKDTTFLKNIDVVLNNMRIKNGVKLTIDENSTIKVSGDIVCDKNIMYSNAELKSGDIIEGDQGGMSVSLIVLLFILGIVLIIYVVGFFLYKYKVIKWNFLKYLYGFI